MSIPLSQNLRIVSYLLRQKLKRRTQFPLVLMLEPLFACNLSCAGCGKIQYPTHILQRKLSPESCWAAAEECNAPIVSIAGGEPLLHPDINQIIEGLISQKRYIYLCTNAVILEQKLGLLTPNKHLILNVHIDGLQPEHDRSVCREGIFNKAVTAMRKAIELGFRVTTNTTVFADMDPHRLSLLFDFLTDLGVEGMTLAPGFSYTKAPDQKNFLTRKQSQDFFQRIFSKRKKAWNFSHSPFYLEFLKGNKEYQCTPWGNPTYNIFGWQRPCYLLADGYAKSYDELLKTTEWKHYGTEENAECANCMAHAGFEPTAVIDSFRSWKNLAETVRLATGHSEYRQAS